LTLKRIFEITDYVQLSSDEEPVRSVVSESSDAVVIVWHLLPGQRIRPHRHPAGQDTWIVLSGHGIYSLDADAETKQIFSGQIVVALTGQVHGVVNDGNEPLQFVSVVAPADAGYVLL
jgi:quercetin dioxygenase-like cupin family protein